MPGYTELMSICNIRASSKWLLDHAAEIGFKILVSQCVRQKCNYGGEQWRSVTTPSQSRNHAIVAVDDTAEAVGSQVVGNSSVRRNLRGSEDSSYLEERNEKRLKTWGTKR